MKNKMKKIKEIIVKHDELSFVLLFFVIIFGITMYIKTEPTDEIWNFQNIYKMYNGYKIYIDANVITTPLFHVIGVVIFKLCGANFFIFRLYGVLINTMIILGIYKIQKSLGVSKTLSVFFSMIFILAEMNVFHNTTNYNNLCIMFETYGLLFAINKNKISNNKFVIIEAIIVFLIFITKQNIGIFYLIFIMLYNLIFEKENKWENILKILGVNVIFGLIFIFILYKNNILNGFINYTVLGISEFASRNFAVNAPIIKLIVISAINTICVYLINKKQLFDDKIVKNINIMAILAFSNIMVAYPIFNVSHIDISLVFMYLLLMYIFYNIFIDFFDNKKIVNKITKISLIILLIISVVRSVMYFNKIINTYEYSNLYFGSMLSNELKYKINEVTEYINNSEENVVVVSTEAALYMMPLNRSNGNLDEPLLGNFGKDGEDGAIKEISEMKNTKIIINKEAKKDYQESEKIIQYIKNNLNYIGSINDLLIYQTKE